MDIDIKSPLKGMGQRGERKRRKESGGGGKGKGVVEGRKERGKGEGKREGGGGKGGKTGCHREEENREDRKGKRERKRGEKHVGVGTERVKHGNGEI